MVEWSEVLMQVSSLPSNEKIFHFVFTVQMYLEAEGIKL